MNFLCDHHRNRLLLLNDDEIKAVWFEWILKGGDYYAMDDWSNCIPYVGSCRDLMVSFLLSESRHPNWQIVTAFTLSSIYLSNTLNHAGRPEAARSVLARSSAVLHPMINSADEGIRSWLAECIQVLFDINQHALFFQRFLGLLPFVPFEPAYEQLN